MVGGVLLSYAKLVEYRPFAWYPPFMAFYAGVAILLAGADDYELPDDLRLADWHDLDRSSLHRLLQWVWKDQEPRFQEDLIDLTFEVREALAALTLR